MLNAQAKKGPMHWLRRALEGHVVKRPVLWAFLLSGLAAALFVLPFVLRRGGIFYVSNDQITQQMPLIRRMVQAIHQGQWLYDFNLDLGTGLVEGYAWYNLGSIFFLVHLLLPAAVTPYLLGPMIILKFACAGALACLYFRRFTRTGLSAVVGGLLYAFCGVAISNMVFPFQDMYTLFPLLPLGMEYAMEDRRPGFFAVAVALNALVNPTFFVGAVVFMVVYFAVRVGHRAWQLTLRRFARLLAQAACGVALGGVLLAPFAASLLANPRLGATLPFGADWLLHPLVTYFEILRALVMPPEVLHLNSMMVLWDANSPEFYLPIFGTVLVLAFVAGKKRHWLKSLLLACFALLLIPILNSTFSGFNAVFYTRWMYMPMLFSALASVLALEDEALPLRRGFVLWGLAAGVLAVCMVLWCTVLGHAGFVTYQPLFIVNLLVAAAGLVCTGFSRRLWRRLPRLLPPLVMLFAVVCGGFNLLFNQQDAAHENGDLMEVPARHWGIAQAAALPDGVYRVNAPVSTLYLNHGSPFSFNSTVSPGIFRLQAAFGRNRTSLSTISYQEPGLWALLGVEYVLVRVGEPLPLPHAEYQRAAGEYYDLYRNPDALPLVMGFTEYIPEGLTDPLPNTQKSITLLHGLVLDEEAAAALPALAPVSAELLPGLGYDEGVAARRQLSAGEVTLGKASLSATVHMPTEGALLITLPYDTGWRCEVNGRPTQLVQADWGLSAVACPAGEVQLTMRYTPPGLWAGAVLSALGLAGLLALVLLPRMKRLSPHKGPNAS